jgi:hypothetical protein
MHKEIHRPNKQNSKENIENKNDNKISGDAC